MRASVSHILRVSDVIAYSDCLAPRLIDLPATNSQQPSAERHGVRAGRERHSVHAMSGQATWRLDRVLESSTLGEPAFHWTLDRSTLDARRSTVVDESRCKENTYSQ
jgi:hypothetical protein